MSQCLPSLILDTVSLAEAMPFSKKGGSGGKRPGVGREGNGSQGAMSQEECLEYRRLKMADLRDQLTPPAAKVPRENR